MWRILLVLTITVLAILFHSCTPEYVAPIKPDCEEVWNKDTTMIAPTVYLDYPGAENNIIDEADIVFSNYDMQLIEATSDEMMEHAHIPNWMGHTFSPVEPGMYYIRFMIPAGYNFVMMDTSISMFDSDTDSDVVSQTGFTDIFQIQCHEQIRNIRALIQKQ